jgi:hypothetical protein
MRGHGNQIDTVGLGVLHNGFRHQARSYGRRHPDSPLFQATGHPVEVSLGYPLGRLRGAFEQKARSYMEQNYLASQSLGDRGHRWQDLLSPLRAIQRYQDAAAG